MNRVPEAQPFEFTHDVINLYNAIRKKYPSSKDLMNVMKPCRKYNNESRYPYSGREIYTEEFAAAFISYTDDVKSYIDNECAPAIEDLRNKFNQ